MVTAPWGTGKTYYINNHLIPFLNDNKCAKECIVISLYSVHTIDDLCRVIFSESKLKAGLSDKSTVITGLVAKTIFHGVSSILNMDLGLNETDHRKFFTLFDYSNKVLIFEDIERTKIKIMDLLGFVNNLTEIDNLSVILVVSEPDLKRRLGEEKNEYERSKEKSIYQTVCYTPSNERAIYEILSEFGRSNDHLQLEEGLSEKIQLAIHEAMIPSINYRSFQHGVQQYLDLCEHIHFEVDREFMEELLLSIIIYSLKKSYDDSITWVGEGQSIELGSEKHPLYDFVYDFINNQHYSETIMIKANGDYIKQREFRRRESEIAPHIDTIINYFIHRGDEVEVALKFICENNKCIYNVPKQTCIKLYGALIALNSVKINQELVKNSKEVIMRRFDDGDYSPFYWDGAFSYDERSSLEWKKFKEYVAHLNDKGIKTPKNYDVESIHEVARRLYTSHNDGFIYYLDNKRLIELIKQSDSKMLHEIRGEFLQVYESGCPGRGLVIDYPRLIELKQLVGELLPVDDPIIQLQLEFFISNLDMIIKGFELQYPEEIQVLSQQYEMES